MLAPAGTGPTGINGQPIGLTFEEYWVPRFAEQAYEGIDATTFQELIRSLRRTFATWQELTTNRVRGGLFMVDFTDQLSTVPVDMRIVGMQVVARYGTDYATGHAAPHLAPPAVYFELRKDSTGLVPALVDEKPTTTARTQARWVQSSGTDADKLATFEWLQLEDRAYKAGDVVKYQFPNNAIRLIMWRNDSVGFQHPTPTGLDSDPIYAPFALPAVATSGATGGASQAQIDALTAQLSAVETALAALAGSKLRTVTTIEFDREAEYSIIYSGTFTLDPSKKVVGVVVCAYLGYGCSAIAIPNSGFHNDGGVFEPSKKNEYRFHVAGDGLIHYYILPY